MSSTNRGGERAENDAYYTPDNLAEKLVATLNLPRGATVWEPHAGGGAFVRALLGRLCVVYLSDIDPAAPAYGCLDAYSMPEKNALDGFPFAEEPPEWIVGNPPYNDVEAHVRHALSTATTGVAFLLRLAFLEGKGRVPFWRDHPAARVYVLSERPSFTGGKTDSCAYGWFIWDRRHIGATELCVLSWR